MSSSEYVVLFFDTGALFVVVVVVNVVAGFLTGSFVSVVVDALETLVMERKAGLEVDERVGEFVGLADLSDVVVDFVVAEVVLVGAFVVVFVGLVGSLL